MSNLIKPILMVLAFLNLIFGMLSGLGRLGWSIPLPHAYAHHASLMIGGFLGTLIALEKVIPLKKRIFYAGPLLSGVSVVAFLVDFNVTASVLQLAAGLIFILVYLTYLRVQYSLYLMLALSGSVCWVVASGLLLNAGLYPAAFPWYMGFLLFTIVSERLELSRFLPVTRNNKLILLGALTIFTTGILLPFHGMGKGITGVSLILISIWLLRYDVIRLTIRKQGLTRFTAVVLTCGYTVLCLEGVLLLLPGDGPFAYDMIVHTFFLGFVFSMIFAHGPMILPGVLGISVKPYHPVLYFPVFVLLATLLMRLLADASLLPVAFRAVSGWISMGSILLYFFLMMALTVRETRSHA